jgi:tetratricopeptide (TPR) repeat protein
MILAWLYSKQNNYLKSEEFYKKALALNPRNKNLYFLLGQLYRDLGRYSQSEGCFKKVIMLDPRGSNLDGYVELGQLYRQLKRYQEAGACFKKAIELNPNNDRAYGGLAVLYEETGRDEFKNVYYGRLDGLYDKPVTRQNYLGIKKALDKKGIKLVCVQYPMRSIQPLKEIFSGEENVIFADNEKIFKDAVRESGYDEYFKDMFGGDFGHCTRKGNRLLAENIANTILKGYFHRHN